MKLSQFKFKLPEEKIALHPTKYRDESRLLVLHRKTGEIEHKMFKDVLDYFDDKDVFIFNDTKVFPARLYGNKEKTGAKAYLVNTGWNGTGKRISIRDTRGIIDAILDGSIDKAPTKVIPFFDFVVPTELPGVDPKILDPRDTYECACQWEEKAKDLAGRFIKNFAKFTGNEAGKALVAAGPKL